LNARAKIGYPPPADLNARRHSVLREIDELKEYVLEQFDIPDVDERIEVSDT
jgi:hypothetical protein